MSNTGVFFLALLVFVVLFRGCGSVPADNATPDTEQRADVRAAELFTWEGEQPISFVPPSADWEASPYRQGGLSGVSYVKQDSIGERISVAEHSEVGRRDGCVAIIEVLDGLDVQDTKVLTGKLHRVAINPEQAINPLEKYYLTSLREYANNAILAIEGNDVAQARQQLNQAMRIRSQSFFTLPDFVDKVMYAVKPGGNILRVEIGQPGERQVGGESAQTVDYEIDVSRQLDGQQAEPITYAGREVYVMSNNRLFVASFQGLSENLPLFERLVETVTFPSGRCTF